MLFGLQKIFANEIQMYFCEKLCFQKRENINSKRMHYSQAEIDIPPKIMFQVFPLILFFFIVIKRIFKNI